VKTPTKAEIAIDRGFGKLGKLVQESKGIKTVAGKIILRATVFAGDKIAEKVAEKFKAEHGEKKAVKDGPKKADNQHNKDCEKAAKAFFEKKENN
jgi:hypothetical protein